MLYFVPHFRGLLGFEFVIGLKAKGVMGVGLEENQPFLQLLQVKTLHFPQAMQLIPSDGDGKANSTGAEKASSTGKQYSTIFTASISPASSGSCLHPKNPILSQSMPSH